MQFLHSSLTIWEPYARNWDNPKLEMQTIELAMDPLIWPHKGRRVLTTLS